MKFDKLNFALLSGIHIKIDSIEFQDFHLLNLFNKINEANSISIFRLTLNKILLDRNITKKIFSMIKQYSHLMDLGIEISQCKNCKSF
jgi:hypothetical protein